MKTLNFKVLYPFLTIAFLSLAAFAIAPDFHFEKSEHDFGTIAQGIPQKAKFTLINDGDESLIITKVKGSCGCTATNYSKEPIAPGGRGTVEATYNAKAHGPFKKTVSVYTNAQDEPFTLTIKGIVTAP